MINLIFFGLNILLIMLIWNFVIKKSILDHYRDQLFDLRDEVRSYFIVNNIPLDSPAYKNLRDLLNAHLRFTEKFTFLQFVILEAEIKRNIEIQNYLRSQMESMFSTDDPNLKKFIIEVRNRSKTILMNHIVNSSGMLWLITVFLSPIIVLLNIARLIKHITKHSVTSIADGLFFTLKTALVFIFSVQYPLIKKAVKKDLLEEFSYKAAGDCNLVGC